MEKEPRGRIPKAARYPLFLVGLVVIIFGALAAQSVSAPVQVDFALGTAGFIFLILAVAIR